MNKNRRVVYLEQVRHLCSHRVKTCSKIRIRPFLVQDCLEVQVQVYLLQPNKRQILHSVVVSYLAAEYLLLSHSPFYKLKIIFSQVHKKIRSRMTNRMICLLHIVVGKRIKAENDLSKFTFNTRKINS